MSNNGTIGFGGFLLGLGIGYLVFRELNLAINSVAWILVIIGATIVLSALIRWVSPGLRVHNVVGGLAGGIVFALLLTQGFGFLSNIINIGNSNLPFSKTEVKTYTGISSADSVYLRLGSMNGQITLSTWEKNEYYLEATITGRGSTQKEAEDNLVSLSKELSKIETNSQQKLTLIYSTTHINNPYQINIDVKLPASAYLDLDLTSSNGVVTLSNVNGGNVIVHTSNGAIHLNNIIAETIRCTTSNGAISGTINSKACSLTTSNGKMTLRLLSTLSGSYTLMTSNGEVDIIVGPNAGYKLDGSTSNGDVTFNIPSLTYSKDTRTSKVAQTDGYDTATTQISINIQTSNSNLTIRREVSVI